MKSVHAGILGFAATFLFCSVAMAVGHHHYGAPAPLLAAGLPAFAAVGGGAAVMGVLRRFRPQR